MKSIQRNLFPELALLAEQLGLNNNQLMRAYFRIKFLYDVKALKLSADALNRIFIYISDNLSQSEKYPSFGILWECDWLLDQETALQGIQLVSTILKEQKISQNYLLGRLFARLLKLGAPIMPLVPELLLYYVVNQGNEIYVPVNELLSISPELLIDLITFTTHENPKIQQGAIALWSHVAERLMELPSSAGRSREIKLAEITFDWQVCLSLVRHTDIQTRKKGILLLIWSDFPIDDAQYRTELCNALESAQDTNEVKVWRMFLAHIWLQRSRKAAWQEFLEKILDSPQRFAYQLIAAALESYKNLVGKASAEIQNEAALGLLP